MRSQYQLAGLRRADVSDNPIEQFRTWLAQWEDTGARELNPMVLSTVDSSGWPAARVVLLKGLDDDGFVFYTNCESAKGQDLERNGRAALTFVWDVLERQVRVVGTAEPVSDAEADDYFATRPRGSQIGAWASAQSQVIDSRAVLEDARDQVENRYESDVPRPPYWGGYRVRPDSIEFWQGRPDRLHDRLRYLRAADGWRIERLSP